MGQTSYQLIKAAVHFQRPERLPVQMAALGVADNAFLWQPMNLSGCGGAGIAFAPVAPNADAWGCIWQQTEVKNMGQVVGHPLADGIPDDLSKIPHPDYNDDVYYHDLAEPLAEAERAGKYV